MYHLPLMDFSVMRLRTSFGRELREAPVDELTLDTHNKKLWGALQAAVLMVSMVTILFPGSLAGQGISVAQETIDKRQTQQPKSQETSLRKIITIKLTNAGLEQSLQEIARLSGLKFGFSEDVFASSKKITYEAKKRPVEEVLSDVLKGTGLRFRSTRTGDVLIESTGKDTVSVKTGAIAGVVVDSVTGKEVSGATIRIRGTDIVSATNNMGQYSLRSVPTGAQAVEVRAVGYKLITKAVSVEQGRRIIVNVSLNATTTTLREVVTTVTGMQRKIEIGNDVTTINADSVMKTAPIRSVTELLEGRVPGLEVTKTSGVPGAPSRLRLRGIGGGLITGVEGAATNDPIVIVDGIRISATQSGVTDQNLAPKRVTYGGNRDYNSEYPTQSAIDLIDPNSIERIDIYKGPSAAALYGSDAANGVIVITTKKGTSGQTKWSVSMDQGLSYLSGSYAPPGYYVFCSSTGVGYITPQVCGFSTSLAQRNIDSVVRFQALDNPSLTQFGTGYNGRQSASVSGGEGAYRYSVIGTVSNEQGILKMPSLYQQQFKSLYDSAPAAWMKRPNKLKNNSITASFSIEPRKSLFVTFSGVLNSGSQLQSSAQLQIAEMASSYIDTLSIDRRTIADYATKLTSSRSMTNYAASLRWTELSYLPVNATIGNSRDNRKSSQLTPYGLVTFLAKDSLGYYSNGNSSEDTRTVQIDAILFPEWKVSTAIGFAVASTSRSQFQGINDSLKQGVTVPTSFYYGNQGQTRSTTGGWFLEPRLNLNSRLFVNPGFRLDGNTLSGSKGGLWSLFPKLNFSWIAIDGNEQSGILSNVSMLRPRISFGVAGVQPAPGWQLRLLSEPGLGYNVEEYGLFVGEMGNTNLHPERTREIEAGFDLELHDGRYTISFSQWTKIRKDAIEMIQLPYSVYGAADQYVNIGEIKNTGLDVIVNARLLESRLATWQVYTSLSKRRNKLVKLNSDEAYIDLGNGSRYMAGYPMDGRWERPIVGYSPTVNGRLTEADVLVADSAIYMGNGSNDFDLPFSTSLSLFGSVGVNLGFLYKSGMTQFNAGKAQHLANLYFNPDATPTEQAIALAAQACVSSGVNSQCSRYGLIQTVNTLRFNSMSISYNLPRNYTSKFGVPSVRIAIQGSNLGLWTNYRGKDPDVNSNTVGEATVDNGQLPQARKWGFEVRLGN